MQTIQNAPAAPSTYTNGQLAIIDLLDKPLNERELELLKKIIFQFKVELMERLIDEEWDKRGYTQETVRGWLKEHMRTPYNRPEIAEPAR